MTALKRMAVRCCARLYRAYFATLRIVVAQPDSTVVPLSRVDCPPDIFAVCERDALALGGIMAGRGFATIVAHSRDGDWASVALETLGCRVIRGSTARGGVTALVGIVQHLMTPAVPAAIVVDGPLGPAGVAKPGVIVCGIRSHRAVRAIGVAAAHGFVFRKAWSRIFLPLPFTTLVLALEPPLSFKGVPQRAAGDHCVELTLRLRAARDRAAAILARRPRRFATVRASIARGLVTLRDALLTIAVVPVALPVCLLPWTLATGLGRWYGYLLSAISPRSRRIGLINLRRAFGAGVSMREGRRVIRAAYASLGQSIAEGLQLGFGRWQTDRLPPYECDDPELERRILGDPRPKLFVTAHLGSWELAVACAAARTGGAGAVVFRRVDNRFIDALWQWVRHKRGADFIEKRGAAARAAAALRAGQHVAMLIDENGGYRGVFVPFFGRPASTRKTPAVLSLLTGAPIVLGACIRRPGHPYLYRLAMFEPPRHLEPGRAVLELTARVLAVLETWIRDDPAQWRWVHWRWKTRPDGSEERYRRADLHAAFAGLDDTPAHLDHTATRAAQRPTIGGEPAEAGR
jgi:KDO2-lipid IV(A) lauroyltransferase